MIFLFLSSLTALSFPALLGAMIDAAQDKQSYAWLPASIGIIGAIAFAILFVQSVVSFFRIRLFVEVAEKALADTRRDSYHHSITLTLAFFSHPRVRPPNNNFSPDSSH